MPRLRYDTPPVPADHESPLGNPVDSDMPQGGQMVWASGNHPPGPHPPNRPTIPPVRPPGGDTSPPRNTARPVVSGTPRVGSALTATSGAWDGNPQEFVYFLLRAGVVAGPGGPTPVYTCEPHDEGLMLACRVRAINAHGYGEADSFMVGPVEPEPAVPDPPPVNTALPVISGTAQIGHSLSSTPGSWTNNPSNYVYQWVRLPFVAEAQPTDDIPGAVNPTYLCQAADVGRRLLCRVTALNSEGRAEAESLPYGPVRDLDWNPPTWLIRDSLVHEYDPIRPRPAYVVPTPDPVFHTVVTRITGNQASAIPNIGGNWGAVVRHPGFQKQAWNCDQSLIYISENSGEGAAGPSAMFLQGDLPYAPQFGRPESWPSGTVEVCWHPTEPDLMDMTSPPNVYSWFNVRTGENTVIRTFAGATDIRIGMGTGNRSADGKMIVFTPSVGGQRVAFAYDIENDIKHPDINPTSIWSGTGFSAARITGDGKGILLNYSSDNYWACDLDGGNAHPVPGGSFTAGAVAVTDVGVDPDGHSFVVGRVNSSGAGAGPSGTQSAWRTAGGGVRNQLTFQPYLYHASARDADVNHTGHARWVACDSRANRGGGGEIQVGHYTCEVVLLPLEGGAPYRICHHMNGITQDQAALTQPSPSPDGQRCIFASTWNAGDNAGEGTPRPVAVFVADYRSATQPPAGTPPVNTVRPAISGTPVVGQQLICNNGTWTNGSWFARRWRRDGDPIVGATAAAYTTVEVDVGHQIDCQVICVSTTGGYTVADAAAVGPITRPGGGEDDRWEPPSWVIYDRTVRDYNPARARPDYLVPTRDPNFNGLVTRVSGDPGTPTGISGGGNWAQVCGPNYINHQAWSCDQSLLYILNIGGTSGSLWLDGETYQPRFARGSNWPSGADVRWHPTEPDLMDCARTNQFSYYNPRTNTNTVVRSFTGVTDLRIGHNKGNRSDDGKIVVLTAMRSGRQVAIVYDIERDTVINELDSLTVLPGRSFSSCWTSPSGTRMIWNMSPDNYVITDFNGAILWDFPTNYISHGDCCFDEVGEEVLCGRRNSSSLPGWTPNSPSGEIWKHRLRDGQRTQLSQGGWSPHTACRGQIPENQLYCVAATYDNRLGGNSPQHPPYIGEIIMPTLDGTRVYRLCQHMGNNGPEYETFAFAVQSPDSGRVAFRSDWRAAGATPRPVQAYVVDIRE